MLSVAQSLQFVTSKSQIKHAQIGGHIGILLWMSETYSSLRIATFNEATEIVDHYDVVYKAIHEHDGSIDWPHPTPVPWVERYIDSGRMYVMRFAGKLTATACLDIGQIPMSSTWPQELKDDYELRNASLMMVSRLAAFKPGSPRGSGAHFLQAAESLAIENSCSISTLACSTDNAPLHNYYSRHGYVPTVQSVGTYPLQAAGAEQPTITWFIKKL